MKNNELDKYISPFPPLTPHESEIADFIIEECAEVIQRVSKMRRFGIKEVQTNQPYDNAFRLSNEIGDLLEVIDLAKQAGMVSDEGIEAGRINKKKQLAKYMQTTPEETSSNDPFEMSNAELGAITRRTMAMLDDVSDERGVKRIAGAGAALFLVASAVRQNAARATINLTGAMIGEENTGDWTVLVLRPNESVENNSDDPPVVLGGWLYPDKIDTAIECFEKLAICQITKE